MYVQLGKKKREMHPLAAAIAGAAIGVTAVVLTDKKKREKLSQMMNEKGEQVHRAWEGIQEKKQELQSKTNRSEEQAEEKIQSGRQKSEKL
ncbi:MAG TPA: hypothetical protein VMR41_03835 [Patescibacteria group bacterium]|nr:hypothetical protein [Patescibacteria group bacterium]